MANGMNEGRLTSLLKRLSEHVCDWVVAGVRKMRRAGAACAVSANGTLQKSADWKRSAKRKLVGAEGVIITLALIASLGIVSPLVASAGEAAEASHPVSGVIGETDEGVAAVDVDEDAEAVDAADAADSADSDDAADADAATDSDAAQDGDDDSASAGDSDDPAGDGADADAEGEDSAEESGTEGDGDGENSAAESTDTADDDGDVDGDEDAAKDAKKQEGTSSSDATSKKKARAATTTNTFESDGGVLNLGYVFSHYNVVTVGNADLNHTVGPVLVGGDFNAKGGATNIGGGKDVTYEEEGRPEEKGYVHKAHSYVRGSIVKTEDGQNALRLTKVEPHNSSINLYLGVGNQSKLDDSMLNYLFPSGEKNGEVLFTDDYLNFTDLKSRAIAKSADLQRKAIDLGMTIGTEWVDGKLPFSFAEGVEGVYAWQDGKKLVLKAGGSYILTAAIMAQLGDQIEEVIIDASGVEGADGNVYQGGNAALLPETTITITGNDETNGVNLPDIKHVRYRDDGGQTRQIELASANGGGSRESAMGIPLVWNVPDATQVQNRQGPFFGHVIAPNAKGKAFGDYNGCWLVDSMETSAEGHMWPYNGKRLFPAQAKFQAKKILKDWNGNSASLAGYTFEFELWDVTGDNDAANVSSPSTDKGHRLLETKPASTIDGSISFTTEPSYSKGGTYYYVIVEKVGSYANVEYTDVVQHVTVTVTSEEVSGGTQFIPNITVKPLMKPGASSGKVAKKAKAANGSRDTVQTLEFVNTLKKPDTAKLSLKKEMKNGHDAESSAIFNFSVTLTLPFGSDPEAAIVSESESAPQKIYFDNNAKSETYGFACEWNEGGKACATNQDGSVKKREFSIPSWNKLILPVDYTKFRVDILKISEDDTPDARYVRLVPLPESNPKEKVPESIKMPELSMNFDGFNLVQCQTDLSKQCKQKTFQIPLGVGETFAFNNLPVGTTYSIQENLTNDSDYCLEGFSGSACSTTKDGASCTGTLSTKSQTAQAVATNVRREVELSIKKEVDAWNSVPEADRNKEFTFGVALYDKDKKPLNGTYNYTITSADSESDNQESSGGQLSCSPNGSRTSNCGEIRLKHGQTATITGLPYGTRFVVTETDIPDPFEFDSQKVGENASVTCKDSGARESENCQVTSTNGVLVTVTNRYSPKVVLPSTGGKAHPIMTAMFGLGVVCAGLAIAMLYLRRCE